MIRGFFVLRNFECATQQLTTNLWRETRRDRLEARRYHIWITAKETFKGIHGWIKHRVMLLEESNEFAHLGFVRRKFPRVLGHFDESVTVACFLDLWKQKV